MGLVVTTKGKVGPEKSSDPQNEATFAKCNYRLCSMELPQAQRSDKPPGFLPKQQFYISERDLIELHFSNAVLSIISPTCQGIQPLAGQVLKRRHESVQLCSCTRDFISGPKLHSSFYFSLSVACSYSVLFSIPCFSSSSYLSFFYIFPDVFICLYYSSCMPVIPP